MLRGFVLELNTSVDISFFVSARYSYFVDNDLCVQYYARSIFLRKLSFCPGFRFESACRSG